MALDQVGWDLEEATFDLAPTGAELVEPTQGSPELQQFLAMERAFCKTGGQVSGDELARLLGTRWDQPISMAARWIVGREALSFEWQSNTRLPLFQFDLSDMTLRPEVTKIIRELPCFFDGWDIALWFAQPNAWLGNSAPVDIVNLDLRAVLEAARADRFAALG